MTAVEYRSTIYDIFADQGKHVTTQIDRALDVGTEYLDLPIGFFTRIDEGVQEIVQATGDHPLIQPGESCPLGKAYCRRTIQIESPLAVQNARVAESISDAAVELFDLGAYIGARVVVNEETYGTVCFANTETKDREFTAEESFFVELLARLVGQAIERREHKQAVKTRDEVYRAVVNASFDLVFQIDADGRFTFVSSSIEDLLGYEPEEYIGHSFTSMLPDEETVAVAEAVYEQVLAGQTVERQDFPLEHKSDEKEPVPVDIRVTPLYNGGGREPAERTSEDIIGVQGMARDARDRHRRQRMIQVLNRVLRHNLRNDMNIISGYADILEDSLTGEPATYARKIGETTDRLVSLSETARKLETNIDSPPDLAAVDIIPVVRRVTDQINERYPNTSVTVSTPESAIAKSAPRLETALWELLDNAARHGGTAPQINVTVLQDSSHVRVRISDDGPGLPEQERAVLVSGEETPLVHGSGLGLWLVHWIVVSLDGKLTVQADTDADADADADGLCVEITLERASEAS